MTMPRTINSIVESHQLARERRDSGKPIWNKTIRLYRPKSKSVEDFMAAANEYEKILKKALPAHLLDDSHDDFDEDLDIILFNFREISKYTSLEKAEKELNPDIEKYIIETVDALYDWADQKRYWIEFKDYQEEVTPPSPESI